MRLRIVLALAAICTLAAPAVAQAAFAHVVAPGESLSSIAAADGVSVSQLAAANGLPANTQLVAGATVQIPPQRAGGTQAGAQESTAPTGYLVRPGDTLSGTPHAWASV
jgi:N-acetylmuramoyl-L-alanine amidase